MSYMFSYRSIKQFSSKLINSKKYGEIKLNFKNILTDIAVHKSNIKNRKADADVELVAKLYTDYMKKLDDVNLMRKQLNTMRRAISDGSKKGLDVTHLIKDSKKHSEDIDKFLLHLNKIENQLMTEALQIPNLTHPDSPVGGEEKAEVLKVVGKKPEFDFKPLDHLEIGKKFDLFDFENAIKISGSRFAILKNQAAILELALINWTIQFLIQRGYTFVITPDIVKSKIIEGCGFIPRDKSASQIYLLEQEQEEQMGLVATSEIACAGLFAGEVVNKSLLPKKFVCLSHCFRKEAGQGHHSRGLYRLHQFTKVEMFGFTEGNLEQSESLHQEMLSLQEEMYSSLNFHFRVLDMPTEELGASAYRKYDIEAYFPSKGDFGEISSTSNCTDYQALRLNCLYFDKHLEKKLMHTVNGTAMAVPRVLMGILENFQTSEGKILIPECLHPYTFGMKTIG